MMYLVAGATGQTGGATADSLLARGASVTVLVRRAEQGETWRARGASVAVGSLDDAAGLTAILAGVDGAYLLVPPSYTAASYIADRRRLSDAMAGAVARSGVAHVVLLSSFGAQLDRGTGPILTNHNADAAMRGAARGLTLLQPAIFLDNWRWVIDAAIADAVLPSFLRPDLALPQVSTRDVGALAAECLLEPAPGQRTVQLLGPEGSSPTDVAVALSGILGRRVVAVQVPEDAVATVAQSSGLSADVARLFAELYAGLNAGRIGFAPGAERRRGPTGLDAALREIVWRDPNLRT
jgi:uncharacterized protein YbjT (DUF2867 family)